MKTLYALFGFLLLLGCKSASTAIAPQSFTASSEKGLAIGTVTFEGDTPSNDIYRFFYGPTSGDRKFIKRNSGKVMMQSQHKNGRQFTGDFNNGKTYLFVIEADPGNYAFTQYNFLDHIGPSGMVSFSKKFAIPFEIKKGEIAYIGEFSYKDKVDEGTPKIFISGNYIRDIAEFKKKFPQINWEPAMDKTVKSGDKGGGIIEFL
ncbi:hypothetical protein [uncultured Flavobacterium sp.]|uniref:hypothetical protein n=1 Tax=uncultured Flavobacterium sp. TaxID=165435 RepID=UPI0025E3FF45|nr:hypothetical protein [uncultured Flavobacterium sp.]